MDNVEEFGTISSMLIGVDVATFLLNTGRGLQAMMLGEACLIFLKSKELEKKTCFLFIRTIKMIMFNAACMASSYTSAERYAKELLVMYHASSDTIVEERTINIITFELGKIYQIQNEFEKAKQYYQRAIDLTKSTADKETEAKCYLALGGLSYSRSEYHKAKRCYEKAVAITVSYGDRIREAIIYGNLGRVVQSLGEYDKAEKYYKKALEIRKKTGDREEEANDYGNLGTLFYSLGEYEKAKEYIERALAIRKEIGDRKGEATDYGNLGTLFQSLGEYRKAKEYTEKALAIRKEIGDREGEAADYGNLGTLFQSLGEYGKAKEYTEKAIAIRKEIGDRKGEAADYGNLGTLLYLLGEYEKTKEYTERALAIRKEIGDREGEATDYGNLGTLFQSLGEYGKAKEYTEEALAISKEIGDRKGEAAHYGNLGTLFQSLGEYEKAKEYTEEALAIRKEIGDRVGEATDSGNLGTLFRSLGEYEKAKEYTERALAITKEIGYREREATDYGNLGRLFQSLGKYGKAKEYTEKALAIRKEMGHREGEAADYRNLGALFQSLGEYGKAKEYTEKALAIRKEIGNRKEEATDYGILGSLLHFQGELDKAEVHFRKAISICKVIGHNMSEFQILCALTVLKLAQSNFQEASSFLYRAIEIFEKLRDFVKDDDYFKIALMEEHGAFPYQILSKLLSVSGNPEDSLYVEELRRARALADLMTAQYSAKQPQFSGDPQSALFYIHDIIKREANCTFVYLSVDDEDVRIWVLKTSGGILFRRKKGMDSDSFGNAGSVPNPKVLFSESFRHFAILPTENYEDRSLNDEPVLKLSGDVRRSPLSHDETEDMKTRLRLFYKLIIAPVADLLKEPEIIIVPDSCMYQVPFAALLDEGGRYLSEKFRMRVVPSLTVLKVIQDSPSSYHSKTGALIVGEPEVSKVIYRGKQMILCSLPAARKEAEMIGKMLGVIPLLGKDATKEAVLEQMKSVALIHFAAHGNPDRGEIALSPVSTTNNTPQEEEYLLTMADVSKVQLRAKLVVLSCCHSGRGEIKVEGVIGIARAFLGSGARSVLVARWALDDESTEQFMKCFYEHLFRGESASESLHEVRKWMRGNPKYSEVKKWATFMLIGDNVTLR